MALIQPLNDRKCLGLLHEEARRSSVLPSVVEIARKFVDSEDVVSYIRELEQRDDLGDLNDGPRLPCDISQRARFAPIDPNCYERTLFYLAVMERVDPQTERSSASLLVDRGWHTFPVEIRDGLPQVVVLDPKTTPPRNAMVATAYDARNVAVTARDVIAPWFIEIARNACVDADREDRFEAAMKGLQDALFSAEPLRLADANALDYAIDLALEDAALWGPRGCSAADTAQRSLRNLSLELDRGGVEAFFGSLARTGKRIAPQVLRAALISQFGPAAVIAYDGVQMGSMPGIEASAPAPAARQPALAADGTALVTPLTAGVEQSQPETQRKRPSPLRRMSFGFRTN